MLNARVRLTVEKEKQKRLLLKESRIERILANMKRTNCNEEQFAEVSLDSFIPFFYSTLQFQLQTSLKFIVLLTFDFRFEP